MSTSTISFLQTISDTRGRFVSFNYNISNQLISITQAEQNSTVVHTYATFTWGTPYATGHNWYNFSGFTTVTAPAANQISVLTGCTYANSTGYRFTYGDWGIINKIETLSASGLTRSYVSYNYPLASAGPLTDAPAYTQETISPDGTDSNTSAWNYAFTNSGVGVVTSVAVTDPLGSVSTTTLDPNTGLMSDVQVKNNSNATLMDTGYAWTQSGPGIVPSKITTVNDIGQVSFIQYAYDSATNAGNVSDVYEYDFGSVLKRHTVTTYLNSTNITSHILSLPTKVLIEDGAGNVISRTDLAYDGGTLTSITGAANHDDAGHGSGLAVRGNLTSMTRYANAAAGTGAVTRNFTYDTLGNVLTAQLDCCNNKVFNFSSVTQYNSPDSVVRGPVGLQFISRFTYNPDTGLPLTSTDENSQVTQYQYDSMNRTTVVTLPPQGSSATKVQVNTSYDDNATSPTVTKSASASPSGTVTVRTTVTTMDGLGHVLRVDTQNGSTVVSSTKYTYDKLWRSTQASNPFGTGETPVYTNFSYDALGRRIQVAPPSGGNMQYSYSGNTVTITDPAGKQRKSYTDALGRLVEVDEPGVVADHTPAGNRATMQTDGNFVLSDILNDNLWQTGTAGQGGSSIEIQDDGNFVLYAFRWQAGVYAAGSPGPFPPQSCSIGHALNAPQTLPSGKCITSPSGQYMLYMAPDGNLYIYDIAHNVGTWGPGTQGHPGAYAAMQTDGNFVVYDVNGVALWSSGTNGTFSERLEMENDGRILVFKSVWNSGTMQPPNAQTLAHPSCDVGTGVGTTGVLGTGQCIVSFNGLYEVLLQNDGNLVLNSLSVTPAQVLWSSNTALTPLSKIVTLGTTYSYDPLSNLTGVAQASAVINGQLVAGQPRSYTYDSLGRLTSATTPESGTVTNDYTGGCAGDPSLVCRTTDARNVIKTFTYDAINRPTGVTYSDGTPSVTYTYDTGGATAFALDRLTKITEGPASPTPVNSHTFTYDNLGRIITDSQSIDQNTYAVHYAYNLASQITSITYPSGRVVTQNYDAIGRTCSIGASAATCAGGTNYLTGLTYNAAGETLGFTLGNNVQGAFTYNDHLQLSTLRYFKSGTTPDILNLGYDYTSSGQPGNNGQIQAVHYYTQSTTEDQTKSEKFTYDVLGRLSAAQTGVVNSTSGAKTWSLQWAYDRLGNRLSQTMVAGDPSLPVSQPNFTIDTATNRITNSGYTYDAAGNMTHDANAAYTYDGANRLTTINATAAVYSYFGPQRIKKSVGSTTTRYIYSGTKPIAEYVNGSTTPSTEYIYAGSQLLVTIAGSTTTYHHPDHLSNRAETDSTGASVRTFGHLPYGDSWYETGTPDKWKFTSYERDSAAGEAGLDYANFRNYASGQGRFMSADLKGGQIRTPRSLNRYAYVGNDPINGVDPSGLMWLTIEQTFCTNTGSGDNCVTEFDSVWIDDGGGGGPLGGGAGGGAGGSGPQDQAAKRVLNNSDCFAFILNLLNKLFGQQNTDQARSINRMTNEQRSALFQAQHDAVQPMTFIGTIQNLNITVSSTPNTDNKDTVAQTNGTSVTLYPLFFSPGNDQAETLIHEAFHSGTYNFGDTDIARALGISFKDWQQASQQWDKELEKHCGTNTKK